MAALLKGFQTAQRLTIKNPTILYTTTRNHWNKDYKPGPYPITEKERDAAAKKYNMLPEEYRPYPNDGIGYGDYPKIDLGWGVEARDPYYPYDFPEHKRNFGEPLSVEIDRCGEDRYGQASPPRYKNYQYFLGFFGVMASCFAIYGFLERMRMFRPVMPKQYPSKEKVHYTFDLKK